jgi:hypothetical protein
MQIQLSTSNIGLMPILNSNRITENQQKEAVMAMGLAACQARCLNCGHCAHHCGK